MKILVGLTSLVFGWAVGASAVAQSGAIPTAVVQLKSVGAAFELDGVIEPVKQSTISAQATGRIATLLVRAGDKVRAGQLLATIDDRVSAADVVKARAQINQTTAELRQAQANLERTGDLRQKGFVSQAALEAADAQHKSALAMHEQANANATQSQISQGFARVASPYEGFVLQTLSNAGDLAVPGKPLLTLYAPQPMRAVVQVPGSRLSLLSGASEITVGLDDAQGHTQWITPLARSTVPAADPVSQTSEWRLELPAAQTDKAVVGQKVRVRFAQGQVSGTSVLWVPSQAIVRRTELTAVYVATDKTFALRAVRLGAATGANGVEVLAGLKAGDVVALDPLRAAFANATPAQK